MTDAAKFLAYVMKELDTTQLISNKIASVKSKFYNNVYTIKHAYIDTLWLLSCNGDKLISDIVKPIEKIFSPTEEISTKDFQKATYKYYALPIVVDLKIIKEINDVKENYGNRFFISLEKLDLDTMYRKWQLDNILKNI